jgi:NAD-dependent DNA ligase
MGGGGFTAVPYYRHWGYSMTARLKSSEAAREIAELSAKIREHDAHYYQKDAPVISDAEYDTLRRRLEALEAAHPEQCVQRGEY